MHRRLRVVFAYNATAGLSNQFYCNVNMVAIAMAAGTEVALSTAWHRNGSFAIKYSDHPWPKVRRTSLTAVLLPSSDA